ncbi:MAG: TonB family protein [Chitinivibrionales bacterium]|nr:TonB family protein [Chitinivibrionales bacterium]
MCQAPCRRGPRRDGRQRAGGHPPLCGRPGLYRRCHVVDTREGMTIRMQAAVPIQRFVRGAGMVKKPLAVGVLSALGILVVTSLFNSAVIGYRLRELDRALSDAARFRKERRNLAMLIQYELLKQRMGKDHEEESDYRIEAELQRLLLEQSRDLSTQSMGAGDRIAVAAIGGVRLLMGKPFEPPTFVRPHSLHLRLAYQLERQRRYRQAIIHYEQALPEEPGMRPEILLHQAFCYSLVGNFERALLLLDAIQKEYPQSEEAATAARLYDQVAVIRDAAMQFPTDDTTGSPLARAADLYRTLRYNEALSLLTGIVTDSNWHPDRYEALFLMGRTYEHLGRDSLAASAYNQLVATTAPNEWTMKAHQRLVMLDALYGTGSDSEGTSAKALEEVYFNEDFVADIAAAGAHAPDESPAEAPTVPVEALTSRFPAVAALVRQEAAQDSFLISTAELMSATIDVNESPEQRKAREAEWQAERKRFLEQQRQLRAQQREKQRLARDRARELQYTFAVAESIKTNTVPGRTDRDTAADSDRQTVDNTSPHLLARLFSAARHRQRAQRQKREERLARIREEQQTRERLDELRSKIEQRRREETRLAMLQERNDQALGRDESRPVIQAAQPTPARITANRVVYRQSPSADAGVAGLLYRADSVTIIGHYEDRLRVALNDGRKVWIATAHCAAEEELGTDRIRALEHRAAAERHHMILTRDSVTLLGKPQDGEPVAAAFAGDSLYLVKRAGGSLLVRLDNDLEGWIPASTASWYYHLSRSRIGALRARGAAVEERVAEVARRRAAKMREELYGELLRRYRSKRAVDRILTAHTGEFMRAYNERLRRKPDLQGLVKVSFIVRPEGSADSVRILSSSVNDKPLANEVVAIVKNVRFEPLPTGAGPTSHEYTIPFVPAGTSE